VRASAPDALGLIIGRQALRLVAAKVRGVKPLRVELVDLVRAQSFICIAGSNAAA